MLKKIIKYTDYEGQERTEPFYFNLTKIEVTEMDIMYEGGLVKTLEKISQTPDIKKVYEIIKEIVLSAYGEKSLDGKKFVKNKDIRDGFSQTEAYSELMMELLSDANMLTTFISGIIPNVPNQPQTTNLKTV